MKISPWKTVLFIMGILAVAALLVVAAKAAEAGSFSSHHREYRAATLRLAVAAHHLR